MIESMKTLLLPLLLLHVSCLTPEELAAFTPRIPGYTDINTGLQSVINATDNGDGSQTIYTNAIPSHYTWKFPLESTQPGGIVAYVEEKPTSLTIFSEPVMRAWDNPIRCLPTGSIGIATSGVSIFGWFPAQTGCPFVLDTDIEELDPCEGHPSPHGTYHYHHYSPCVQMPTCGEPSTIWGVALDGIPIYGPYDEDGRQLTKFDLDECGGKNDSSGRYKYHITVDPFYSVTCLRGELRNELSHRAFTFFCGCPFDDRPFDRNNRQEGPQYCEFGTNMSEPALCQDNMDTSYDIGYTWEYVDREVELAACCPAGEDCGYSCKDEDGSYKDVCTREVRTIKELTRVGAGNSAGVKMVPVYCLLVVAGLQLFW